MGRSAQVPAADDHRVPPPTARHDGRRSCPWRWRAAASRRWPRAASTISSAAASRAMRPMRRWLVPHFEKMLYDNAQLARVYLHAWQLTGETRYRAVAEETLDYLLRELRVADGPFAASQDADTDGVEGATYTWSAAEVAAVLGAEAPLFAAAYDVTAAGQLGGPHDPAPGRQRRRARRSLRPGRPPTSPRRSPPLGRASSRLVAAARSRPATTRRWRPGTAWRWRPSPTPAARSERRRLPRRCDACRGLAPGWPARPGGAAAALVEGRPRPAGRRPRGLRPPRRRPAGALRGDLRRALVHVRARRCSKQSWRASRTRPGASSTRPTTTSASSRGPKGLQDNALPSGNAMAATCPAAPCRADRRGTLPRQRRRRPWAWWRICSNGIPLPSRNG